MAAASFARAAAAAVTTKNVTSRTSAAISLRAASRSLSSSASPYADTSPRVEAGPWERFTQSGCPPPPLAAAFRRRRLRRQPCSPLTAVASLPPYPTLAAAMDRLSYSYLMDDMVRGHLLTMEVILKPKVTLVSARSAQPSVRAAPCAPSPPPLARARLRARSTSSPGPPPHLPSCLCAARRTTRLRRARFRRASAASTRCAATRRARSAASRASSARRSARHSPSPSTRHRARTASAVPRVTISTCSSASSAVSAKRAVRSTPSSRRTSMNTTSKTAARTS